MEGVCAELQFTINAEEGKHRETVLKSITPIRPGTRNGSPADGRG